MLNDFAVAVIAVKLLRAMGTANDSVYHATPTQMEMLCYCIYLMSQNGCEFSDEQIDEMVDGGEYNAFLPFAPWQVLNHLLDEIFTQYDDDPIGDEDGLCRAQLIGQSPRWKLRPHHIEFDGVPVLTAIWPMHYGEYTPERLVELLNQVTVKGR